MHARHVLGVIECYHGVNDVLTHLRSGHRLIGVFLYLLDLLCLVGLLVLLVLLFVVEVANVVCGRLFSVGGKVHQRLDVLGVGFDLLIQVLPYLPQVVARLGT